MSRLLTVSPADARIEGTVRIPGSKSYTNRALVIASIAEGKSVLHGVSLSDDSTLLISALEKFGVKFEQKGEDLTVFGTGGRFKPYQGEINVGAAGTSMRFLIALCALAEGSEVVLSGSERMHQRPSGGLVTALQEMGAEISFLASNGCPPLRIRGKRMEKAQTVKMDGTWSSQYFTSLLLVSPLLQKGLTIEVQGEQISKSYIDMTISSLQAFGVEVINHDYRRYEVKGRQTYVASEMSIEPDLSGASYFWALAAIAQGRVRIEGVLLDSVQGDLAFPKLLKEMGCSMRSGGAAPSEWIEIEGTGSLKGISADMESLPDTAQTLAVVAAFAKGETHISGLSTLRIKETDRLFALQNELIKVGIESEVTDESIRIHGGEPHAGRITTYDDHRMAMSFALLGSVIPGVEIEDPQVVSKSFPSFWHKLSALGVRCK